jgi:hypothetical protein
MSITRPEVTGKKAGSAHADGEASAPRGPPEVFTVPEFCDSHRISQAFYYKLKKMGIAPTTMKVGNRTLISRDAAAAWRREREEAASAT